MGRKQAREGAMKLLFQMESNNDFSDDALNIYLDNFKHDEKETEYIKEAVITIRDNVDEIDNNIILNLEGWSIHRLAKVDLSVLRLAIYEILYRNDIPVEVSINEAIETVKKYSKEDSFKFINGVLGGFVRSLDK
ncbi:transcription antitermination factor NusB [Tissierella sp. Yu-01]|uniref:transcription antitermination factor NusB n=1 Tax=Tissierella sp. Yu-01 TaxID=3035694 RepID=UPI00240DCF97|nr:transcription antitermination factor NusB [Tissierella sp. Yu-01]WFA09697.1 transcription antitermination factor NusB [Tissierella sp. Yu-01]